MTSATATPPKDQRRTRLRRSPWFYAGEFTILTFLIVMAVIEFAPISWIFATSLHIPSDSFDLPPDFGPPPFTGKTCWPSFDVSRFPPVFLEQPQDRCRDRASPAGHLLYGRVFVRPAALSGRDVLFFVVLSSLMVPATVIVVPDLHSDAFDRAHRYPLGLILPPSPARFDLSAAQPS